MIASRLAIIGLGLIGGSLSLALRESGKVTESVGFDVDAVQRSDASRLGVVDRVEDTAAAAVQGADIVVVAVPVMAMESAVSSFRSALSPKAVITDVGSTKASVIKAVSKVLDEHQIRRFVPAHPIAGTEKSGASAARADLYRNHRVVMTPVNGTNTDAVERVRLMWEAAQARVETMSAEHHDSIFAATSHLPHVLAYALVDLLSRSSDHQELFRFAAGGFKDFTRIASSSPQMWHDIVRANQAALLPVLDKYLEDLSGLRQAIAHDDSTRILDVFFRAKTARERYLSEITTASPQPAQGSPS